MRHLAGTVHLVGHPHGLEGGVRPDLVVQTALGHPAGTGHVVRHLHGMEGSVRSDLAEKTAMEHPAGDILGHLHGL